MCADDNLQIVNCTTSAQYFHVLRRQQRRAWRAPLVIFTPKSLLRLPQALSVPADFARGRFRTLLSDAEALAAPGAVERVVLCSGKVYYDLAAGRAERGLAGRAALARVEQLYPWPELEIAELLRAFPGAERVVWAQEEPANMGGWTFVRERLADALLPSQKLAYAGRRASASPAAGSMRVHREEQAALVAAAFDGLE
jgi:2-oxoglutarate dehydrogenase E1 component